MRKLLSGLSLAVLLVSVAALYSRRFAEPVQALPARTLHVIGIADYAQFSPDGKTLAIVTEPDTRPQSDTHSIEIWDTATWQRQRILPNARYFTYFTPDGQTLFCADTTVQEWNIATGRLRHSYNNIGYSVAFSKDRRFFATGKALLKQQNLMASQVTIWNTRSRQPVATIHLPKALINYSDAVFSPDDSVLAIDSGDPGEKLTLWKAATGTEMPSLGRSAQKITRSAFSADGKVFAMTGPALPITFWDTATWQMTHSSPATLKTVDDLKFSSTGTRLMVAGEAGEDESDSTVILLDAKSGEPRQDLPDQSAAAFSQDGGLLATDHRGITTLWNAATGSQVAAYSTHTYHAPAFSPDDKLLATVKDRRGDVMLWNVPSQP